MITGVGTDIVEIRRIKQAMAKGGFGERIFTPAEREYCLSGGITEQRFAGRFAAKEAVAKSLGVSLSWLDVEVLADPSGKPIVNLLNRAAELADGRKVMVSISHCRSYAVAYAVAATGLNGG
jgi:holo-[acyl-carrier protein] synthase